MKLSVFLVVLSCLISSKNVVDSKVMEANSYYTCIPRNSSIHGNWSRQFFYKNKEYNLTLEVTDRASHRIIGHILAILLRDRLRYKHVQFNVETWDKPVDVLKRLTCSSHSNCQEPPVSHINPEVWLPPGFGVNSWIGKVVDCGPLGPIAHRGIFASKRTVDDIFKRTQFSADHWRVLRHPRLKDFFSPPKWFTNRESHLWTTLYDPLGCKKNCPVILVDSDGDFLTDIKNLTKYLYTAPKFSILYGNRSSLNSVTQQLSIASPDQSQLFFVDWFPNTLTVQGKFSRLSFPDCNGQRANHSLCQFEANQLTKVIWSDLKTHAKVAYSLLDKFYLSQRQYEALLEQVDLNAPDLDKEYFKIACDWVREEDDRWTKWTEGADEKEALVIGAMFSYYGKFALPKLDDVSQKSVNVMNDQFFNDTQYRLMLDIRNLTCRQDIVLQDYTQLTETCHPKGHLIGIIAALCSESIEPMLKLSNIQRRLVISPTAESAKFSDKRYQYFFHTIPSMHLYNKQLVEVFKFFGWKRIVVMRKDDHFIEQSIFKDNNITVVEDIEIPEDKMTYKKVIETLTKIRDEMFGRIFILEYFGHGTRLILCAAYHLGMTLEKGYVWFVNPWLLDFWYQQDVGIGKAITQCNITQMKAIINGHFKLTHRHYHDSPVYRNNKPRNQTAKSGFMIYSTYTKAATDAIGMGLRQLLRKKPGAASQLHIPENADMFSQQVKQVMMKMDQVDSRLGILGNGPKPKVWALMQTIKSLNYALVTWQVMPNKTPVILTNSSRRTWWSNKGNKIPDDGTKDLNRGCVKQFGGLTISCFNYNIILYVGIPIGLVLVFIGLFGFFCRRHFKAPENPNKKPYEQLCAELGDLDMPSTDIVLNRRVGQGAFGLVYGGEAKVTNNGKSHWEAVAVKVTNNNTSYEAKRDFLQEAKLMRDLKHNNVVKLIGICLHPPEDVIYLVMEFMLFGDLKTYLLSRRVVAAQDPQHIDIRPTTLTRFVTDIASGVEYLHQLNLIHRDIACRNCLVGPDRVVKIADFGLTRPMDKKQADGYYRFTRNCELPIRWLSPEAVQFGYYSVQSDLWSFGVVLYEIITFGVFPYDGLCDVEIVERVKRREFSIQEFLPPSAINTTVWELIISCCQYLSSDRPNSMKDVLKILNDNPECIKPFLTDEPPKPENVNLNAIPFQPGVGACNMSENAKGRNANTTGNNKLRSSVRSTRNSQGPMSLTPLVSQLPNYVPEMGMELQNHINYVSNTRSQSTEFLSAQPIENDPIASTVSAPDAGDDVVLAHNLYLTNNSKSLPGTQNQNIFPVTVTPNGYSSHPSEKESLLPPFCT